MTTETSPAPLTFESVFSSLFSKSFTYAIISSPSYASELVGLIKENGQYDNGSTKYSIDWEYVYQVTEASALFAYSSLVELGDGRIGMIYEASPTTSWADGLRYMYYEEFTMSELTAN